MSRQEKRRISTAGCKIYGQTEISLRDETDGLDLSLNLGRFTPRDTGKWFYPAAHDDVQCSGGCFVGGVTPRG